VKQRSGLAKAGQERLIENENKSVEENRQNKDRWLFK